MRRRRCSTRAPTSSSSTPIPPRRCRSPRSVACSASAMIKFAPKAQLTSIVDDWAPYYTRRVQELMDGTWKPTNVWEGLKEGAVLMSPYTNMPEDVAKAAEETEQKIASGEFHPFTGPIFKQDGTEALPAGQVMDDGTLL